MDRKYKINQWVKCFVSRNGWSLNGKRGKVIGFNKDGTYNVQFDYNAFDLGSAYFLKLNEDEIKSLGTKTQELITRRDNDVEEKTYRYDSMTEFVLFPSGEIMKVTSQELWSYRDRRIVKWNSEFKCFMASEKIFRR